MRGSPFRNFVLCSWIDQGSVIDLAVNVNMCPHHLHLPTPHLAVPSFVILPGILPLSPFLFSLVSPVHFLSLHFLRSSSFPSLFRCLSCLHPFSFFLVLIFSPFLILSWAPPSPFPNPYSLSPYPLQPLLLQRVGLVSLENKGARSVGHREADLIPWSCWVESWSQVVCDLEAHCLKPQVSETEGKWTVTLRRERVRWRISCRRCFCERIFRVISKSLRTHPNQRNLLQF